METDLRSEIEVLTGRDVIDFMSDNHIDHALQSRCSCSSPCR
jgi:hypothetical protein